MKRYFLAEAAPSGELGVWHAIDLGSHDPAHKGYHAVVLEDDHVTAPQDWISLAHLLDPRIAPTHSRLAAVGAPDIASGYDLAKHLGTIHKGFNP